MSKQRSTLSKQHSTDFVERIVRLVAFDNVASTLLLVWMGLNTSACLMDLSRKDMCLGSRDLFKLFARSGSEALNRERVVGRLIIA